VYSAVVLETPLLLVLVAAPSLAAVAELLRGRRDRSARAGGFAVAGTAAALGSTAALAVLHAVGSPATLGGDPAWLRGDAVTLLVAGVASTIALTVLVYARRYLDPGSEAVRTAAGGSAVLAGTLLVASAGRLTVLVAGWLLTTLAVVALLHHPRLPARRTATMRTVTALGSGDLALVVAAVVVLAVVGDPALDGLGGVAGDLQQRSFSVVGLTEVSVATLVAGLLVLAALARASQLPFPAWLPGTVAAPTPTSALLHAGVVNAGAVLLIRSLDLVTGVGAATALLALATIATVLVSAGAMLARSDAKGALAVSTSAQMGFMLLAVVVGAPAAALTHLVGHAFYKASRFLGAGEAVGRAVTDRRHPVAATLPAPTTRAALALGLPAAALTALWLGLDLEGLPAGEAWLVAAAAFAAGAQGTWALFAAWDRPPAVVAAVATGALLVVGGAYLALVTGLGALLDPVLTHAAPPVDARVALGALAGAILLAALAARRPALAAPLAGVLGGVGRSAVPRLATVRVRPPLTATTSAPALEGSW
jgi:NADH:ubiquinone oxidoreductase subunit 5 (subunit L)/multisubunit Na+/H+ antiporter MnhA subunit